MKTRVWCIIVPTILDLLGIKIKPEFLFGKSLFENETVGWIPNLQELNLIFQIALVSQAFTKHQTNCSTCLNLTGLYKGNLKDYVSFQRLLFQDALLLSIINMSIVN